MNIGIVGLGLIGGSLAKTLKKNTNHTVFGFDRDTQVLEHAKAAGAVDNIGRIDECDIVYVCLYPVDTVEYILQAEFKMGAIVTDACGVKRYICDKVSRSLRDKDILFVGSHPMAGKEVSGFENSDAALFDGASYIITVEEHTDQHAVSVLSRIAVEMGFGNVTKSTPEDHDRMIAYTSQLAHVVSNSYVKSSFAQAKGYSAGSFEDLTRVARMNETLWSELFLENGDFLCDDIDVLIASMNRIKDAVKQKNGRLLRSILKEGSDIKKRMLRIEEENSI